MVVMSRLGRDYEWDWIVLSQQLSRVQPWAAAVYSVGVGRAIGT
jgi:hypothetical protein